MRIGTDRIAETASASFRALRAFSGAVNCCKHVSLQK